MKRSVKSKDMAVFAKLDMVYNHVRVIEAKQNQTEYKCLGSGKCCTIGLRIHMAECANIAFKLTQEYYLKLEDKGYEFADEWMNGVIESLKEAMHDPDWQPDGETTRHCAFYKNGCTIYGYRPMVCRTFGTITTVDDYCPRIRNANGQIDYFTGDAVRNTIQQYQMLLAEYASDKDSSYNAVVYMPLGVLSFLLDSDKLQELSFETDAKFWDGVLGWYNYRVEFTKRHGYDIDTLKSFAEQDGNQIAFDVNL